MIDHASHFFLGIFSKGLIKKKNSAAFFSLKIVNDSQHEIRNKSFIALGSIIYNDLFKDLPGAVLDEGGRVVTNADFETSIPGIFAIGDLVAGTKMQIYTAWEEAVIASEAINRRFRMEKRQALMAS